MSQSLLQRSRSWLFASAGLIAASLACAAPRQITSVEGITEYRLANGLQVLLAPDDSKPTTTVNLTIRAGSRQENYGETGMAHLLEHMLFKGTPTTRNPWAEFTKRGLRANGTTWFDRTNYFASFAANDDNLRWYLGWQADALVNSFIARRDLDTEMTVVRNEMEMGENSPSRMLIERALSAMYEWHNYGKSTIGARSDVENVDVGRLKAFYRQYYQPDNATVIVSGKFEPAKVLAWVEQSFGRLPKPRRQLPRIYTLDAAQDGERSVTVRRVGGVPMLVAGYHVPAGARADFQAVELLGQILADEPSGRLHKRLVESGRAAAVFADSYSLAQPGVLLLGAQLGAGQEPRAIEADLVATVEGLAVEPVTEAEFSRARTKWLKNWERQFSDAQAVGVALSESVALGDWRLFFLARDRMRTMTLADVQRVAVEYLLRSNRTLAVYVPSDKPQRAPAPRDTDLAQEMRGFVAQPAAARVPAFDASPANLDAQVRRVALGGGAQAALLAKPTRGQAVQVLIQLRFGDAQSLAGQTQVAAFAAALLDKGTASLSRQQIQDQLDQLKTELSVSEEPGQVTLGLRSRREHVVQAIALAAKLLREPTFTDAAFEEVRRQAQAALAEQVDDPEAMVENLAAAAGNPHPRGAPQHVRSFSEIGADMAAVTPAQVREFHQRFYGASQALVAVIGDFDPMAVQQELRAALGDWRSPAPYARVPDPYFERPASRKQIGTPDKQNAALAIRQSVPLNDSDADYPALYLANFLLGAGGDSRLWRRVREREGLSYSIWSGVNWSLHEPHSAWSFGAIFAPTNRDKIEAAIQQEFERVLAEGFSAAEVAAGKKALLNFRRLSRAQDQRLAGQMLVNLDLDRRFAFSQQVDDALAALGVEQVNAALRKHLRPQAMSRFVAGDFKP